MRRRLIMLAFYIVLPILPDFYIQLPSVQLQRESVYAGGQTVHNRAAVSSNVALIVELINSHTCIISALNKYVEVYQITIVYKTIKHWLRYRAVYRCRPFTKLVNLS